MKNCIGGAGRESEAMYEWMNEWLGSLALDCTSTLASSGLFLFLEENGFCCQVLEHGFKLRSIAVATWEFPSALFSPNRFTRMDVELNIA